MVKMKMYMCLALILSLTAGKSLLSMEDKDLNDKWFSEISKTPNKCDLTVIIKLLSNDPSLQELEDENGNTGLHIAASKGNHSIVLLLLSGSVVDSRNRNGQTAYDVAHEAFQSGLVGGFGDYEKVLAYLRAAENASAVENSESEEELENQEAPGIVVLEAGSEGGDIPVPHAESPEQAAKDVAIKGLPKELKTGNKNPPSCGWKCAKGATLVGVLGIAAKLAYDNLVSPKTKEKVWSYFKNKVEKRAPAAKENVKRDKRKI